jgi:signal peptidase II
MGNPVARKDKASGSARLTPWLGLSAVVILLDQLAKIVIERTFSPGERVNILPVFDLTLWFNTGAAFSFLAAGGGWQRWLFTGIGIVAALVIVLLLRRHAGQRLFCCGLALILGGAVGNVIDRLWHARVTDFLLFYWNTWYFPAFNLADSAITLGVMLLIADELLRVRRSR